MNFTNVPEWLQSAIRQGIAAIGLVLAGLNIVETAVLDQVIPAIVALVLIASDILRTRDLEDSAGIAFEMAEVNAEAARALQRTVDKLTAENATLVATTTASAAETTAKVSKAKTPKATTA